MRAEKVVYSLLNGNSGVTAIVGTRIYAMLASQADDTPYVIYWKEGANRTPPLGGQPAVVEATINLIVATSDYPSLKNLAEACRVALLGQFGTIAGVVVNSILVGHEGADVIESDQRLFWQPWQYLVNHLE